MREFETIVLNAKPTMNGFRATEELVKIQFFGTELVRCKDCKWYHKDGLFCEYWAGLYEHAETYPHYSPIDFCSRGERRENDG